MFEECVTQVANGIFVVGLDMSHLLYASFFGLPDVVSVFAVVFSYLRVDGFDGVLLVAYVLL